MPALYRMVQFLVETLGKEDGLLRQLDGFFLGSYLHGVRWAGVRAMHFSRSGNRSLIGDLEPQSTCTVHVCLLILHSGDDGTR